MEDIFLKQCGQTKKADLLKEWKISFGLPVQENWFAEVQVTKCERSTGENPGNNFKSVFSSGRIVPECDCTIK